MAEESSVTLIQQQEPPQRLQDSNPLHNLFSLFENFKLQFPQPKPSNSEAASIPEERSESKQTSDQRSAAVRFPERRPVHSSLKLREDGEPEVTNAQKSPAVMWQLCAVGALAIARWAWSTWQKRKNLKKPSDDDHQNDEEGS